MFDTLRTRLTLSHILPLLILLPLLNAALIYIIERQFLAPSLSKELASQARFFAELITEEGALPQDSQVFQLTASRAKLDPNNALMVFDSTGELVFTNDPRYENQIQRTINVRGLEDALAGQELTLTNISLMPAGEDPIQVYAPSFSLEQQVLGVVRLTSGDDLFWQLRLSITLAVVGVLVLASTLGLILARRIGNPVQEVTTALHQLARGGQTEELPVRGPREVRLLVQAINHLVGRLRELEATRHRLLANLVHELGRPLGALRSAIQALAGGAADDPQLFSNLTRGMDEEAVRLQYVVEELDHLHDQVLGGLEIDLQLLPLGEWLITNLSTWQPAAEGKGLTWKTKIPKNLPEIQIDSMRLGQALGNLLHNAIRYTPPGKHIEVEAGQVGDMVWIRVSDEGPGIQTGDLANIFNPFFRGEQGRRFKQGMGLGLSIARDNIQAHGGRLEVESVLEKGSSFTIWLPV